MMLMAAIVNPVFNHEGMTILTYLPSGDWKYEAMNELLQYQVKAILGKG